MALTNADFRRMIAEHRDHAVRPLPPLTLPDRIPHRFEAGSRRPAHRESRDVRTIEIVWTPAPAPSGSRLLGGLAAVAKVLALPVLLAGSLCAQPVYECHKQKSRGMLYYGTTVQMCVNERMAEHVGSVQAFVDRHMQGM
ncbi:hypothetical protein [Methylobacterium frigidaeris]|uniref:Uncharacterized protein n=1 Tax=Methylobacterium frigidaeris TaxID=2038277 RepID=A0AA37H660_9HYPH|nr:hypothetical protein [Methylobacterium frigidaeris]PIK74258.1 hypothetical protein CS379_03525 [Methylobacterium frigidaeris]GJD60209.1 hypothetical protein MPEAHAMD_0344 [Methylobacterium frigidaeris]